MSSVDPWESFAQRNEGHEQHPRTHGLGRYPWLKPRAQARFVDMMRLIPRGLVIVFASRPYNDQDKYPWQGSMGMLVSSFNSVAVNPTPFVSFNAQLPSGTFDEIRRTLFFTVVAVSNAKVADAFTGHTKDRYVIFDNLMNGKSPEAASQGLLWWMRCNLVLSKCMTVGDHVIVIGQVVSLDLFNGTQDQEALVYSQGSYRLPGVQIKPEDDARRIPGLLWAPELPNYYGQENSDGSDVESKNETLKRNERIRKWMARNNPVHSLQTENSKYDNDTRKLQGNSDDYR